MGILKTIEESSFENLPVVKNAIYDVLSSLINDEISTIHTLGNYHKVIRSTRTTLCETRCTVIGAAR